MMGNDVRTTRLEKQQSEWRNVTLNWSAKRIINDFVPCWSEVSSSKGKRRPKSVQGGLLLSCGHSKQREGCGKVCSEMLDGDVRGVLTFCMLLFTCCWK